MEKEISEQSWGSHADEIETLLMLVIDSTVVDVTLALPAPAKIICGKFIHDDESSANYSPDGVYGDPTLATIAKRKQQIEALFEDVLKSCDNLKD